MSTPVRPRAEGQPARTAWARSLAAPVRDFIATETGSALVLVAAAGLALIWANVSASSYDEAFATHLSVRLGGDGISLDLRSWINEGLMTFFFLVVGLEAKRELDVGDLRERRRVAIPMLAAIGGILVPVAVYLAFNAGKGTAHGWGAAMSTDTALALGAVALLTPSSATRLRVFLITFAVFDDLAALIVIATVYTTHLSFVSLLVALALFGALILVRYLPFAVRRPLFWTLALALWVALLESGIDPVISGLAVGLVTSAFPASREDLERVTELARSFREQPTPDLARSAQLGVLSAVSPNERLQHRLHPWSSYVIVPLFALANSGVRLDGSVLGAALSSPVSLGIFVGYVAGKPAGVLAAAWLGSRPWLRGTRPTISWPVL
ncbi:MAG: Na+/H+ antiporter NhaA, partial [Solirubrobacteraceae bacterium]